MTDIYRDRIKVLNQEFIFSTDTIKDNKIDIELSKYTISKLTEKLILNDDEYIKLLAEIKMKYETNRKSK